MPKAAAATLLWSPARERYEWQHRGESSSSPLEIEDTPGFLRLVDDSSSFAFQGRHGRLTLRKESRRHGEGYWYAYRSQGRRTRKKYLGRTPSLSIARLEDSAEALNAEPRASTDEHSQVQGETIPELQMMASGEARGAALQGRLPDAVTPSPAGHHPPVLVPKLQLPRLPASLVPRERLLRRLDTGLEGKLTLLSAPAGFGKTTVVSQWVADQRKQEPHPPVAWLSLDPADNDPVRYWRYVIVACQALQAERDQSTPALPPTLSSFGSTPLEPMLRAFLNALASLPRRGILILEDYQVITEPEIHESMTFVLEHLPATLHLVIVSRVDPPLPLARWRARGEFCELRADDLRFSQEETVSFLQQALPTVLSKEDIRRLDSRLEGWVTGLRLLTLALQGRTTKPEVEQSLSTFSGGHRHLLEFFVTEVLSAQPEALQVFLLQTSVLSRLSGSLCDAVTGRSESRHLLETVQHAGLFLQSLDDFGQWYRYHPLFAEAMRTEARQRFGAEALGAWYSRASVWHEQQGMLSEAVEMALHAREFVRVATLIEQSLKPHYEYDKLNEYHTLRRWIGSLPEDVLGQHPRLCVQVALLLLFSWGGRADCRPSTLAQIEQLLHLAEATWQAEDDHFAQASLLAIRALINGEQGNLAQASRLAREALACLPESEAQWRGCCCRLIGTEELLAGQVRAAREHLQEAWAFFHRVGNRQGGRSTLLTLAEAYLLQGELRQAAELYRVVLTTAGEDLFDTGKAQLGLAQLSYEWNALEEAWQEAQESLDLGTRIGEETLQVQAALVLATIEQARGEITAAGQRLRMLFAQVSAGATLHLPLLQRRIEALQAWFALAAGDLAAAERWSTTSALHRESLPRLHQEQEDLIAARLLIAQGKTEEALRLLEGWQGEAHEMGRTRREVEILVLMARAAWAQQRLFQASSRLRAALCLAQTEGYQRLFLDEGEEIAALLRTTLPTLRKDRCEPLVRMLLRTFAQYHLELGAASASVPAPSLSPLSAQEQRVLRLLVAGYSNPEIAEALVVSINTVKTQVRSVYQKLNVKSRKEARAVVRSQNLL
jgi:LuxR family transcriptional regulator, maltose regulon positive regulatory protein